MEAILHLHGVLGCINNHERANVMVQPQCHGHPPLPRHQVRLGSLVTSRQHNTAAFGCRNLHNMPRVAICFSTCILRTPFPIGMLRKPFYHKLTYAVF